MFPEEIPEGQGHHEETEAGGDLFRQDFVDEVTRQGPDDENAANQQPNGDDLLAYRPV
jgi:hypothetical protein